MKSTSWKRLMVALALILSAGVAGIVAHRGGGIDAASQHVAAQPAQHGDIGTAAVATKP